MKRQNIKKPKWPGSMERLWNRQD